MRLDPTFEVFHAFWPDPVVLEIEVFRAHHHLVLVARSVKFGPAIVKTSLVLVVVDLAVSLQKSFVTGVCAFGEAGIDLGDPGITLVALGQDGADVDRQATV